MKNLRDTLFHRVSQKRQSAGLFVQSSELGPPPPTPSLACGRGVGRVPNSDEGTYTVVLFIYTYFMGDTLA
jgi:hypothetical protein